MKRLPKHSWKSKDELSAKLQEESIKNHIGFTKMSVDFKELKSDISNHIEYIDHKQKLAIENLRYILERSGNERIKMLTRKIFEADKNEDDDDEEDGANKYRRGGVDVR